MRIGTIVSAAGAVLLMGCSRPSEKEVATVSGHGIPVDEFRARLETYIRTTGARDNLVLRQTIVNNQVNEVLMLEDVGRQGWEGLPEVKRRLEAIRKQALLDGYAKNIVARGLTVSEPELLEEFRLSNTKVSARYVYAHSEEEAWAIKKRLEKGASFAALARKTFDDPGLAENGGYVGYFGKGDMEEPFEVAAFSTPVGGISDPVKISVGYALIRVEDRKQMPLASEYDYAKKKGKLEEDIRRRKVRESVERSALDISRSLTAEFDEKILGELAAEWKTIAGFDIAEHIESNGGRRGNLHAIVGRVRGKEWTVGELLGRIDEITEKQKKRVKSAEDVKKVILGLVTRDILVERASREGLEEDAEVIAQSENVRKSFLLKRWVQSVSDTAGTAGLTENDLRRHFETNRELYSAPPEVNVAEILLRTKSEAESMLARLARGERFGDLAKKYSIRRWSAQQGGELGYGSRSKYGTLLEKFLGAKKGSLIGPERVDPYYGLFKVVGKREGKRMSFGEAKTKVRNELLLAKRQEALQRSIEELRSRASFKIHQEVLENVVLDSNRNVKEVAQ